MSRFDHKGSCADKKNNGTTRRGKRDKTKKQG